ATDGVRVLCHRGDAAAGPNLALTLLDASQAGVRLFLSAPVELGEALYLTLESEGLAGSVRLHGVVRWSVEREDGTSIAGVELHDLLGPTHLGLVTQNPWA